LKIFSFLDYKTLMLMVQVSSDFRRIAEDDKIWKPRCQARWREVQPLQKLSFIVNWKQLYIMKNTSFQKIHKNGFMHCKLKGAEYIGDWKGKKPNNIGMMIYSDGTVYEGNWKDGRYSGKGAFITPHGERYESLFLDGKQVGNVSFTNLKGDRYDGGWKADKPNGTGSMYYANGNQYSGSWHNGKPHGRGKMTFTNGNEYTGEWEDATFHGVGTYICGRSGDKFSG